MDKQAQDARWQALTEDGRQARIASYKELLKLQKEEADSYLITIEDLEKLYGKHNLNPKTTPKTWEDVAAQREYNIDVELNKIKNAWIGYPICDKMIATLKIAKLIELGYGGMVSEEEIDNILPLWIIRCDYKGKVFVESYKGVVIDKLLTFRTRELAEEFMSYESNRNLVKQYHLM